MIQATELRIGNWVLGIVGQPERVVKLQAGAVYQWNNPIELTEEILLKCGFGGFDGNKFFEISIKETSNKMVWLAFSKEKSFVTIRVNEMGFKVKMQYLHQLQNLYYALTGEELEVNL